MWHSFRARTSVVGVLIYAGLALVSPAATQLVSWGNSYSPPTIQVYNDFSNVVEIAAGRDVYFGLRGDGSLIGKSTSSTRSTIFQAGLSNIVSVKVAPVSYEKPGFSLALRSDGTVVALGYGASWGGYDSSIPPPVGLNNVVAVAPGLTHALALKSDGTVAAWGYPGSARTIVPSGLSNVVAIAAGVYCSLALKSDGTVIAWGDNLTNVPIGLSNVVAIAAGYYHAVALKSDGRVTAWGSNSYGQTNVPAGLSNVVSIAAGTVYNLALKSDGKVIAWGYSESGNVKVPAGLSNVVAISAGAYSMALVGDGPPHSPALPLNLTLAYGTPLVLPASSAGTSAQRYQWSFNGAELSGATNAALILNSLGFSDAGTYSVTLSNRFQTATNYYVISVAPLLITVPPQGKTVYGGETVSFSVTASGVDLNYQWQFNGTNLMGETSSKLTLSNVVPQQAGNYSVVVSNSVGTLTSAPAALTITGVLRISSQPSDQSVLTGTTVGFYPVVEGVLPISYQWCLNATNLVGETNSLLVLTNVWLNQSGVYSVVASNSFATITSSNAMLNVSALRIDRPPQDVNTYRRGSATFSVSAAGIMPITYQWQFNGTNLNDATNAMLTLTNLRFDQTGLYSVMVGNPFTNIASYANLSVGQVVNWGYPYAQMGNPPGLTNIVALATGGYHNIALRSNGTIIAWGLDSSAGETSVPPDATNVIAVAAGGNRNLVLKADGTVQSWGYNATGAAAFPPNITNVVAIACGDSQMLALTTDGVVIGAGSAGVPVDATNVVAVAAGYIHSLALKADGTVLGWGGNNYGQASVPIGLTNVVAIAAGGYESLALKDDGSIIGWGQSANSFSKPFDGTNTSIIGVGFGFSLSLKSDGSLLDSRGSGSIPEGLTNLVSIAVGYSQVLALLGDEPPVAHGFARDVTTSAKGFCISVLTQNQRVYRLEYVTSLGATNWSPLPLVSGTGGILVLKDPFPTDAQRFYRVRRW